MKANAAQSLITINKQTKRKKKDTQNKDETLEEIVDDELIGRVKSDCMLDIVQTREKGKICKTNV